MCLDYSIRRVFSEFTPTLMFISSRKSVVFSMGCRSVRRKIRRNWDQASSMDDIYSSDYPIGHWIEATLGQSIVQFVRYQMTSQHVSMWATPCQNRSHQIGVQHAQTDACPALSIIHASLAPKTAPDDSSMWLPCVENSDAVKCLCVSLGVENQMCPSTVRTDSRRRHHVPIHTSGRAQVCHWKRASCAPNRQRGCQNPFWCPNKCQTVAVSVNYRMGPNSMCILICPVND